MSVLPRSRGSHDRNELAALDGEIDAMEYRYFHLADVVALSDVCNVYGRGFVRLWFGGVVWVVWVVVVHVGHFLCSYWSINRLI